MDWGIIISFGSLIFVLIGEIYRSHMLIRRLEKRVEALEKRSDRQAKANKSSDAS